MLTKGIQTAGGIGFGGSEEPEQQYRTPAEETLDLHLHFHEKEILSFKNDSCSLKVFHFKN